MRELLIDFGLPALIIIICFVLIMCGHNGEIKSILAISAGWMFKSGVMKTNAALKSKSEL